MDRYIIELEIDEELIRVDMCDGEVIDIDTERFCEWYNTVITYAPNVDPDTIRARNVDNEVIMYVRDVLKEDIDFLPDQRRMYHPLDRQYVDGSIDYLHSVV